MSATTSGIKKQTLDNYEQQILSHQEEIDNARNQLVKSVVEKLAPAVIAVDESIPSGLSEESTRFFKEGLRQLESTVQNFILVSQLEKKQLQQKSSNVVVRDTIDTVRSLFHEDSGRISVDVPAGLQVSQPEFLIRKVISSLVDNATKHSSDQDQVEIIAIRSRDIVDVSVKDSGKGISSEKLALLFKPLSRVEEAEDFTHQGIGLSLYVNQLIMHYLGGDISATSQLGKGTVVGVRIPTASSIR